MVNVQSAGLNSDVIKVSYKSYGRSDQIKVIDFSRTKLRNREFETEQCEADTAPKLSRLVYRHNRKFSWRHLWSIY